MRAYVNCSIGVRCHSQAINCVYSTSAATVTSLQMKTFTFTTIFAEYFAFIVIAYSSFESLSLPPVEHREGEEHFKRTPGYVTETDREPIILRLEHLQRAHSPEHAVTAGVAAASGRDYSRHVHAEYNKTQGHTCSHTHRYTHTHTHAS